MTRGPCALALILALLPAVASAEFKLSELMQLLAAVPSARARFTETKDMALLNKPLVVTGRLVYVRPDRLERHVLTPNEERVVIAGSEVTVEDRARGRSRTFSSAAHPALLALVESLRATLAGDLAALERHFAVTLEGQRDAWTLVLVPRDAQMIQAIVRIRIGGVDGSVRRIEIDEASGDRSVTSIVEDPR